MSQQGKSPKQTEKSQETREQIMEVMFQLVGGQGYDKTSMREIASAVQMQKPSLYYHFSSKEELFLATVEKKYAWNYLIPLDDIHSLESQECYKQYFLNYGKCYLESFQRDPILQKFYNEVNLQSLRLPSLEAFFQQYDLKEKECYEEFLRKGISLGFLSPHISTKVEAETMNALVIGLSEMMLYRMKVDVLLVWENYVINLLNR